MLDRTTPPSLQPYPDIQLTMPSWRRLPNGVQMCVIDHGEVEVNQIDVYFGGGILEQPKRYVAQLLASMIDKGSSKYSAEAIAEQMAFYGVVKGGSVSDHHIKLSLRCTGSNLPKLMPIFFDYITTPQFDAKEFNNIVEQTRANAVVASKRVGSLSSILLSQMLYGKQSIMANEIGAKSIGDVTIADLRAFHKAYFAAGNCRVVLSGKVTRAIDDEVTRWFGSWQSSSFQPLSPWQSQPIDLRRDVISVPGALQSGIAAAVCAISREHPDYIGLRILTTALGGYFGSRLMSNIREDKGYTYGIHAYLAGRKEEGHITIATECAAQHTEAVIDEIRHEMQRLRELPMPDEELALVRNHMMSDLLKTFDTAFSIADYVGSTITVGVQPDYFNRQYSILQTITPEQLQTLAQTYLVDQRLCIAIAGPVK